MLYYVTTLVLYHIAMTYDNNEAYSVNRVRLLSLAVVSAHCVYVESVYLHDKPTANEAGATSHAIEATDWL